MKNRLIQIDGMRGIAILLVVLFHYTTRFENIYGHPYQLLFSATLGSYGVQLFFIISGFVIFMTLERTLDFKDFVISRFARLYPAYWFSVFLTSMFVLLFSLPGRETSLYASFVNLSMFQEWFGVPHVDGVYWTLTLELSFYAIMLGLYLLRLLKNINIIVAVWLCSMIVIHIARQYFAIQIPQQIATLLLLNYANLFIAGILFYKIYQKEGGLIIMILILAALITEFILNGLVSGLVCFLFFILFGLAISGSKIINFILTVKPLVFIGTISYSLYLLHQNIGYVILRTLYINDTTPIIAIPITIGVSLVLATSVNTLIEIPAKEKIRTYWKKISTNATEKKQEQNA
jgi:peptidoglycan/LPS O-acetylase OafA/YrhL